MDAGTWVNPALKQYSKPIAFEGLAKIASDTNSIYLGQGFPDWDTPRFVRMAMIEATQAEENQYVRVAGHPKLCEEIAKQYSPLLHHNINPMTEINVAGGATSVMANILGSFIKPGDGELICFSPAYLGYTPMFHYFGSQIKWCE